MKPEVRRSGVDDNRPVHDPQGDRPLHCPTCPSRCPNYPVGQTVADLMTTTVQAIDRDQTIATALIQMQDHSVRSLIVTPPNPENPFGILTERDIVYRVFARGLDPCRVRVHDIMRQPCIALDPSLSFQAVAQLFSETGLQRAPVVQDGKLLGILSVTDLVFKTRTLAP